MTTVDTAGLPFGGNLKGAERIKSNMEKCDKNADFSVPTGTTTPEPVSEDDFFRRRCGMEISTRKWFCKECALRKGFIW